MSEWRNPSRKLPKSGLKVLGWNPNYPKKRSMDVLHVSSSRAWMGREPPLMWRRFQKKWELLEDAPINKEIIIKFREDSDSKYYVTTLCKVGDKERRANHLVLRHMSLPSHLVWWQPLPFGPQHIEEYYKRRKSNSLYNGKSFLDLDAREET